MYIPIADITASTSVARAPRCWSPSSSRWTEVLSTSDKIAKIDWIKKTQQPRETTGAAILFWLWTAKAKNACVAQRLEICFCQTTCAQWSATTGDAWGFWYAQQWKKMKCHSPLRLLFKRLSSPSPPRTWIRTQRCVNHKRGFCTIGSYVGFWLMCT